MASFAIGDVHGERDVLVRLLRDAGLVDRGERWSGSGARVWFLGDLVDRGPDGIGVIELVQRLEQESDGSVRCLLGNHDALLVAVHRHADAAVDQEGLTFRTLWRMNGGDLVDLERLEPRHLVWLEELPAVAREGEWLLVHADTDGYLRLGATPDAVNAAARTALRGGEPTALGGLFEALSGRDAFSTRSRLDAMLASLGGTRVMHGHTPIASVVGREPREITGPLVYAEGRAVNVDHCLFAGGPGFVVALDELSVEPPPRPRGLRRLFR